MVASEMAFYESCFVLINDENRISLNVVACEDKLDLLV